MDKAEGIIKTISEMSRELNKITRSCETKDELRTINDSINNLMKNYHDLYRNKLMELDRKQEEELETLRKIKELLNQ